MQSHDTIDRRGPRLAYVMSRFPKLTETFILNEILAVERLGVQVHVFPLLRERDVVFQPGAEEVASRARYVGFIGKSIIASQLHFLRRSPRVYLRALSSLVRENFGSTRLLLGGLLLFPKIVHVARLMEAEGIEHVHCHFATHPALAGLIVQNLTGIPFSFTAHGSDIHVDRHMLCRKLAEASFAIAISDFNRRVIEGECGPSRDGKVVVLHCGVDTELFRPAVGPGEARPRVDRFTILAIGTLNEVKGQRYLLEACAILRRAGVDLSCRLVGRGPQEQRLRHDIARLGLEGRVTLLGALARDQVVEELGRADVLVAPSIPTSDGRLEGIPVVLMEAMSCGLPVVASRLSGIPELVKDECTGLLVTPGNPNELAAALRRLISQPALRERLGREGRRLIERDFDLHANAARLVGMFRAAER